MRIHPYNQIVNDNNQKIGDEKHLVTNLQTFGSIIHNDIVDIQSFTP